MSERMWEELQQVRAERDAAIAERDRLRAEVDVLRGVGCCEDRGPHEPPSGPCGTCIKCARAEGDRLRRELDALREAMIPFIAAAESIADALRDIAGDAHDEYLGSYRCAADRLGGILRGES